MLPLMVVKSPKCDEMVTLPAGLTPDTRVRCPFSKEEFLIQEILDNLPPELEVLERPAGAATAAATTAAAIDADLSQAAPEKADSDTEDLFKSEPDSAEKEPGDSGESDKEAPADPMFDFLGSGGATAAAVADSEPRATGAALFEPEAATENTAAAPFDFAAGDGEEAEGGDASAATGARRKTRPRPQKKQKSAVAEIVKVVLGGVAGLLIAQMILWWLPGSWARDPANLAPKLPGFLSWAAPAKMRNPDAVQPPAGNGDDTSSNQNTQNGEQQVANQEDPDVLGAPMALPGSGDQAAETTDDVLDPNQDVVEENGDDSADDSFDPIGDIAIENPLEDIVPVEEVIGVRSPPVFSGDELGDSLKSASDSKDAIDAEGGLDLSGGRPQAAVFYKAFCKLAERATFVDPDGQQLQPRLDAIEGMLVDLGTMKKNLDAIGALAATWIGLKDNRPGDGIMLAGTVKSIAPQGKLYDTEVQLFSTDQEMVTVMSKIDPSRTINEGDRVIILGTVVDEPSLKLAGYEGNLPMVIWGGYPVALPKANRPKGRGNGGGGGGS